MIKTIYLIGILTMLVYLSASAQEQSSKNVPDDIRSAFASQYPGSGNAEWNKVPGHYEAKFISNGKTITVRYNKKAVPVQTVTYVNVSELPAGVRDYLAKDYPGVKFDRASEVRNAKGILHYQVESATRSLYFDSHGTFIKDEREVIDDNLE